MENKFSIETLRDKAEKMQKYLEDNPGSEPNELIEFYIEIIIRHPAVLYTQLH